MSKVAEGLMPEFYEGTPAKKSISPEKGEKSRDFYGVLPGEKRAIRFVTEKEFNEIKEEILREGS